MKDIRFFYKQFDEEVRWQMRNEIRKYEYAFHY